MITEDFVIPRWVKVEEGSNARYARFSVEPFERGYGTTVGNSMRRVLLASLTGAAVTAIRVEEIQHEFSAIPGVEEDMTDVVLNFKKCDLSLKEGNSSIFSFSFSGKGECTAGHVFAGQDDIVCHEPDLVLFTSTNQSTSLTMEIKVAKGRGYVTSDNSSWSTHLSGPSTSMRAFHPFQRSTSRSRTRVSAGRPTTTGCFLRCGPTEPSPRRSPGVKRRTCSWTI